MSGWIDTPLTDAGKLNAASTAGKVANITFDKIISSDLGRAFATAYIIARKIRYSEEIDLNCGLRECSYGDYGNRPYSALPKMDPVKFADFVSPNGESLAQMQQRVLHAIEELSKKYDGKTILLVAHDGTINAIHAKFTDTNIGIQDAVHHSHDFVAKFIWESGAIKSFEEVFKLPDTMVA